MPRGRPALTEDTVHERIAAYRAAYGVAETNADGFPVFPAGRRESPQHRAWVVLYKAWSRLRARQRATAPPAPAAEVCPLCRSDLADVPPDVRARILESVEPERPAPARRKR